MAVTVTISNHAKYKLGLGDINFTSDTLKIILMNNTFSFDKDADATLADVTSDQLSTGNGYTQDDKTLSGVTPLEDDTNDLASWTFDNATWTASGGSIGPTGAYIIYDDTTADDTVIACVDFGTDYTISDGSSFQAQSVVITIS